MSGRASQKEKLTPQQRLFAHEYLVDLNATAAAKRAGYSEKTARSQGQRLLTKVDIKAVIEEALKKREKRTEITADRVLKELAIIGFADMANHVTVGTEGEVTIKSFDEMPEGASRAISGIKEVRRIMNAGEGDGQNVILEARLEYRHHDKVKALELIGKHLKMFTEKHEHTILSLEDIIVASNEEDNDGSGS